MGKLTWPATPAATTLCFTMGAGVGNAVAGGAGVALTKLGTKLGWTSPDGTPYQLGFVDYIYPDMDNSAWRLKCYSGSKAKVRVWSSGLWPQTAKNPTTGAPVSPVDFLNGVCDARLIAFAKMMVAGGEGNSILRYGWEADGDWFAWGAGKIGDVMFAACFKHGVDVMRAVTGFDMTMEWNFGVATKVKFNGVRLDPMKAFPAGADANGHRYVDVVSLDFYDSGAWGTSAYTAQDHQKLWDNELQPQLDAQWKFAQGIGRPMAVTELGVQLRNKDTHGGGDDDLFVTNTAAWFKAHPCAYVSWFLGEDLDGAGSAINSSRFMMYTGGDWSPDPRFPKTSAAFPTVWAPPAPMFSQAQVDAAVKAATDPLNVQVANLTSQVATLNTQATTLTGQVTNLNAQVTDLTAQRDAATTALTVVQNAGSALQAKLDAVRAALG